jgi:hypothetical protein
MAEDVVNIYLLGLLDGAPSPEITVLAEQGGKRALRRVRIAVEELALLRRRIQELRSFTNNGDNFTPGDLNELGQKLFDLALPTEVRDLYRDAQPSSSNMIHLQIIAEDPELGAWPWEYLYDPQRHHFLCKEYSLIFRGLLSLVEIRQEKTDFSPLKVLVVLGLRSGDPGLSVDEELSWIRHSFQPLLDTQAAEIKAIHPSDRMELEQQLREGDYHILHYIGHAGFDYSKKQGYLALRDRNDTEINIEACDFAHLISQNLNCQLVFLNACRTAVGDAEHHPSRSSIAAALLQRGIPATIATQALMPDSGAQYFAGFVYQNLVQGKSLNLAVREGRWAMMSYGRKALHLDWGIPVLYSHNPEMILSAQSISIPPPSAAGLKFNAALSEREPSSRLMAYGATLGISPEPSAKMDSKTVGDRKSKPREALIREVAIVDLDIKAGFLPELLERANAAQNYYRFRLEVLPAPSGYVHPRLKGAEGPQAYLPALKDFLSRSFEKLAVDFACFLTRYEIAIAKNDCNYFLASPGNKNPYDLVSASGLRAYAEEADISFAAALLRLCLSSIISGDKWKIAYHDETRGCLFDFDNDRDDIVEMLKKDVFDDPPCRKKIKDQLQLEAIDKLMKIR